MSWLMDRETGAAVKSGPGIVIGWSCGGLCAWFDGDRYTIWKASPSLSLHEEKALTRRVCQNLNIEDGLVDEETVELWLQELREAE